MANKVDTGPRKPARISAKQARKGQHKKTYTGDSYISMGEARANFAESNMAARGGRNMSTIPPKPSTKQNGGTRQSRIQRGRQKPL